ncbi:MAG: hypothetical protein JJE09_14180 [Bacteroidia bacterium]|nr:hypothetical protein [Bacteroidia bacterium]
MSSHHFVKEDQEPALLILNPDAIPFEKVQELLEWSPFVLVSSSALEYVLRWGIKIDALITSSESDVSHQVAKDQAPLLTLRYTEGQSELESVFQFLVDRKQLNVNVIVSDVVGYFPMAASYSGKINSVLFEGKFRWVLIDNGHYSKWLPAETTLQTFFNNQIGKVAVAEEGIFALEKSSSFWIGEEF